MPHAFEQSRSIAEMGASVSPIATANKANIETHVRTSEELRASCRQQLLLYPSPRHQQHGKPTS